MTVNSKNRKIGLIILVLLIAAASVFFWAYAKTLNKTEIEFKIHINEQLVYQSAYGESPTFAIWLENPETGEMQTVYVTNRAANNDWAGKPEVPVALPRWFELTAEQNKGGRNQVQEQLIVSGATPKPGYFITRVNVTPGSEWICWIEMNLAGDYNETFKEYDPVAMTSDEFAMGQPALLYKARINAELGNTAVPEITAMVLLDARNGAVVKPPEGITTAKDVFDEISIQVVKPKPKLIK